MDTLTIRGRVNPADIAFLDSTIHAYEGVALVRTTDRQAGLVEFWVAPDFVAEFRRIIQDISTEIQIEIEEDF
jgi:uncharacterized protein YciU (UPF0263 family)